MATKRTNKKLLEITNTRKSIKETTEEPEYCVVTNDEDILDLKIGFEHDLFENLKIDMDELKFIRTNKNL